MATLVRKRAILQPCRCAAIDRAKRVTLGIQRAKAGVGLIAGTIQAYLRDRYDPTIPKLCPDPFQDT